MENQTSKLIELLVNNKKKKRVNDDNINIRDKFNPIVSVVANDYVIHWLCNPDYFILMVWIIQ